MRILGLLLALVVSHVSFAQNWAVTSSKIGFTTTMMGADVIGTFSGLTAIVKFDPKSLAGASISGSVPSSTVATGIDLRDKHLREKEEFFNSTKFPKIEIKSLNVVAKGTGYEGGFNLTMRGVTRFVKIPFTFVQSGQTATLAGKVVINRKDWALGGNTLGMSDQVTMNLSLALKSN
jgi:polyisoprenoid-binding protein YceI